MAPLHPDIKKLLKKYMQQKWPKYQSSDVHTWAVRVDSWLQLKVGYNKRSYVFDQLRDNVKHEYTRLL